MAGAGIAVAVCRSLIARGGQHSLALGGGLFKDRLLGGDDGRVVVQLALSPGGRDHLVAVRVHDVGVKVETVSVRCLVDVDRRPWRKADDVLDVESHLHAFGIARIAGCSAGYRYVVHGRARPVTLLISGDVGVGGGLGLELNKGDVDPLTEIAEGVEGVEAVVGRELVRRQATGVGGLGAWGRVRSGAARTATSADERRACFCDRRRTSKL